MDRIQFYDCIPVESDFFPEATSVAAAIGQQTGTDISRERENPPNLLPGKGIVEGTLESVTRAHVMRSQQLTYLKVYTQNFLQMFIRESINKKAGLMKEMKTQMEQSSSVELLLYMRRQKERKLQNMDANEELQLKGISTLAQVSPSKFAPLHQNKASANEKFDELYEQYSTHSRDVVGFCRILHHFDDKSLARIVRAIMEIDFISKHDKEEQDDGDYEEEEEDEDEPESDDVEDELNEVRRLRMSSENIKNELKRARATDQDSN